MNTKGTNLTFLLMGLIAFVTVTILVFTSYSDFLTTNSQVMDSGILNASNLITSQNGSLIALSNDINANSSNSFVPYSKIPAGIFAIGAIGIQVITSFATIPTYLYAFINAVSSIGSIPTALITMLTMIAAIWVGSLVVKAFRGGSEQI